MTEDIYEEMRARALVASELGLVARTTDHPDVIGIVVDIPSEDGFATLVALQDGATSMYTSNGGGVIGAGEHVAVAESTTALLTSVQSELAIFEPNETTEHPSSEYVRFFVATKVGQVVADLPLRDFWEPKHGAASELTVAVQNLLTKVREQSN